MNAIAEPPFLPLLQLDRNSNSTNNTNSGAEEGTSAEGVQEIDNSSSLSNNPSSNSNKDKRLLRQSLVFTWRKALGDPLHPGRTPGAVGTLSGHLLHLETLHKDHEEAGMAETGLWVPPPHLKQKLSAGRPDRSKSPDLRRVSRGAGEHTGEVGGGVRAKRNTTLHQSSQKASSNVLLVISCQYTHTRPQCYAYSRRLLSRY